MSSALDTPSKTHTGLSLGPVVRRGLARVRRRARVALALRGSATLILGIMVASLVSFGMDRTLRLSLELRTGALAVAALALTFVALRRLVDPLSRRLPASALARRVEQVDARLDWRLVSAVEFCDARWEPGTASVELAQLVVDDAERLAADTPFGDAVPAEGIVRSAIRGGTLLVAGLALVFGFPQTFDTWFQRNVLLSESAAWPRSTHLVLEGWEPGDHQRYAKGSDVTISVVASGVIPSRVYLYAMTEADDQGDREVEEVMVFDALGEGHFRLHLEDLSKSFAFEIRGGDHTLAPYYMDIYRLPWVEDLQLEVEHPDYTELADKTFGVDAGSLALPQRSRVTVQVRTSKRLRRAWWLERRGGSYLDLWPLLKGRDDPELPWWQRHPAELLPDGRGFQASLRLDRTQVLELHVEDVDRADLEETTRFSLVAVEDARPILGLELYGVGPNVTSVAKVRYVVDGSDDYEMVEGKLRLQTDNSASGERFEETRALDALGGESSAEAEGVLDLSELQLAPGMSLSIWAEAQDNDPLGPNEGVSPSRRLKIVTKEQLLNDLLRRLHEQRIRLDNVVEREEAIGRGLGGRDPQTIASAVQAHRDASAIVIRAADIVDLVVDEMRSNSILAEDTWDRLTGGVSAALRELDSKELADARDLAEITQAMPEGNRFEEASRAGRAAEEVALRLRVIAERLGRIEDLGELIRMLKDLIREQRDLLDRTQDSMRGEGE